MGDIAFIGPDITGKLDLLRLLVKKVTEEDIGLLVDDIGADVARALSPLKVSIKSTFSNEKSDIYCFGTEKSEKRQLAYLSKRHELGQRPDKAFQSQVIVFFTFLQEIKEQFKYFEDIRYFPREIHICVNHLQKLPEEKKAHIIKKTREELIQFFQEEKRKKIKSLLFASPESENGINGLLNLLSCLTSNSKEVQLPGSEHDEFELDLSLPPLVLTEEKKKKLNNEFQELTRAINDMVQKHYKKEEFQHIFSKLEGELIDFKEKAERWDLEGLSKSTTALLTKLNKRKALHSRVFSFIDGDKLP